MLVMSVRARGVLGALVLLGCAGTRPLGDPERFGEGRCRARFVLEHEASVAVERGELGGVGPLVQLRFPAAEIDPRVQRPVSAASGLRLDGRPIAWFSRALDAVVLDGAAFAPLRGVDVVALEVDHVHEVGRVTPRARAALGDRGVLELLLRAEVLRTYWGTGADLCLGEESMVDGVGTARIHGMHVIEDERGRRRERALAFEVRIDAEGRITVTGRSAGA